MSGQAAAADSEAGTAMADDKDIEAAMSSSKHKRRACGRLSHSELRPPELLMLDERGL